MKIAMIVGSSPPEPCGVGDFTNRLVTELNKSSVPVEQVPTGTWGYSAVIKLLGRLRKDNCNLLHLQYPSMGYGSSLGPHLLAVLFGNSMVTLHEVSQAHILRRLSLYLFWIWCRRIIFTSEHERNYAIRMAPWLKNKSTVIPIGSNVEGSPAKNNTKMEIGYFGLLRKKKGLEQVLKLGEAIQSRKLPYHIRIIGSADRKSAQYAAGLKTKAKNLPIGWEPGLSAKEISQRLASLSVAYLPYPDGVSERRTSMMAMVEHGVVVITTKGAFTTPEMEDAMIIVETPDQALEQVVRLFSEPDYLAGWKQKALTFGKQFDWGIIVQQHQELYENLLQDGSA